MGDMMDFTDKMLIADYAIDKMQKRSGQGSAGRNRYAGMSRKERKAAIERDKACRALNERQLAEAREVADVCMERGRKLNASRKPEEAKKFLLFPENGSHADTEGLPAIFSDGADLTNAGQLYAAALKEIGQTRAVDLYCNRESMTALAAVVKYCYLGDARLTLYFMDKGKYHPLSVM